MGASTATISDLNETVDELNSEWESTFKDLNERLEEETETYGEELADTKEIVERVQDRLDELEEERKRVWDQVQRERKRDEAKDVLDRIDIPGTEDRKAWETYLRKNPSDSMPIEERKKLISSDDTGAGYLAPPEMAADIIRNIVEMSPVRELAEVRQTSNSYLKIPTRTGTGSAEWVDEGATISESTNPSYGMEQIQAHTLKALHLVTYEQLEDAAVDLEAEIRDDAATQIAKAEGKAFVEGSGNDRPEGILSNGDVIVVATGNSNTLSADGLIDLHYEIKTPYSDSNNAFFIMNRKTIREIRKLKDADNQYLWNPGLASDRQPTILENEYREATDLVAPDASGNYTTNDQPIIFGDFQEGYTVVDRVQVTVQRLDEKYSDEMSIGFQVRKRVGGQVTKPEALAIQEVKT